MFSGIVAIAKPIKSVNRAKTLLTIEVAKPANWQLTVGESILVDGICSTVIKTSKTVTFSYMPETLRKTTVGEWVVGDLVNLERSLRLDDLLSGHLVTGHIDTTATVKSIKNEGESQFIEFNLPGEFSKYLVNKGSVAVNGVSLTVVEGAESGFSVALIPHTLAVTNLGRLKLSQSVNVECDILAKYIEKLINRSA